MVKNDRLDHRLPPFTTVWTTVRGERWSPKIFKKCSPSRREAEAKKSISQNLDLVPSSHTVGTFFNPSPPTHTRYTNERNAGLETVRIIKRFKNEKVKRLTDGFKK